MHVRFYLLGFLRALSRPRPVVLQLVKTFPRHRIRSQSGHLSLRFEGKGRLLFFSPFDGARRGKKKKKASPRSRDTYLPFLFRSLLAGNRSDSHAAIFFLRATCSLFPKKERERDFLPNFESRKVRIRTSRGVGQIV